MAKSSKGKKSGDVKIETAPVATDNPIQEKAIQVEEVKVEKSQKTIVDLLKSSVTIYTFALMVIMGIMLYIRIVPSYSEIFTTWAGNYVNFAQDDAVYHMRLVHNTVANFPFRIFYDPFTHFPYGSGVHFGPLFTLMIAGTALVLGLGSPSPELINTIGAYFPAVIGALCAIPTYYICKKLFSKNAGIIAAATLAFLPGQFLGRSMLGFTDHHIAEVLFATTSIAFLIYALDAAQKSGLNFEKIRNKDFNTIKKPLAYAALAGVSFGAYLLTWPGALLVGFMLLIYFTVQSIVDHMKGRSFDYLVITAALTFAIPAIMVLPYSIMDFNFELLYYSITQPVMMIMALAAIGIMYGISKLLNKNNVEKWAFPATLGGIAVLGMLVLYIAMPQLYGLIMAGFSVFSPESGMLTVGEVRPTYINNYGQISLEPFWYLFWWAFPISIIALFILGFSVVKHNRSSELLFLTWNVIMVWALISQNRFAYYFAINAALLTGYFGYTLLNAAGFDKLSASVRKKVKSVQNLGELPAVLLKNLKVSQVFAVVLLLLVVIWPASPMANGYTLQVAKYGPGMGYEWYDTLLWMKGHTPDPQAAGFDFANGIYSPSYSDDGRYNKYPSTAYGVMSWWDYGHIITYVANRIPNANPFQAGILEEDKKYGSAPFFTATAENAMVENLDSMGTRYIVIDNEMVTGKYYAIQTWANDTGGWYRDLSVSISPTKEVPVPVDSMKFYNSSINRLYYEDCSGMSHFRLVYDSPGDYVVTFKGADIETGQIFPNAQQRFNNHTDAMEFYLQTIQPALIPGTSQFLYDSKSPQKWVKVFEKVEGATITGSAQDGTEVSLSLNLTSNEGREFTYTQKTVAQNGQYSFVVPYPTEAMKGDGYSYDVAATSKYTVSYGNTEKTVDVPENTVINGGTIQVPA